MEFNETSCSPASKYPGLSIWEDSKKWLQFLSTPFVFSESPGSKFLINLAPEPACCFLYKEALKI